MGKFITNDTPSPIYVGGRLIPPYDGKYIDDADLPPEHREAVAQVPDEAPSLDDALRALMAKTVKELVADDLQAIEAEVIRRADEQLQAERAHLAAQALGDAQLQLQAAQSALDNLPADAPDDEREQATAARDEAMAKVDALTPAED